MTATTPAATTPAATVAAATATATNPAAGRPTLLSGWRASGRSDLAAHVAHYGPLPPLHGDFPRRLVAAVEAAGLVGKGGAGFPSAIKLQSLPRTRSRPTLVVNAMEGEPASAKDHVLLSLLPHLVLDGAQLAAVAVGARQVVVCVADDRDELAAGVATAVAERQRTSQLPVPTTVARPPGRYVGGEESALVGWLERGRGVPAFRPERGVPLALDRAPALVHNAETMAHVALLAREAAGASSTADPEALAADRTTLVTVSGAVARPGVLEVPLGTPIADIVAMATPQGPPVAVLVGGFGGSWLGAGALGTPLRKDTLGAVGAAPGAGVLVVLGSQACGLAETARIARYMAGESAGQCGPCVFGLPAIADDLDLLVAGRGGAAIELRLTGRLALVAGRGACRHPDGVVRMVASALDAFEDDLRRHAAGRPCGHSRRRTVVPLPPA